METHDPGNHQTREREKREEGKRATTPASQRPVVARPPCPATPCRREEDVERSRGSRRRRPGSGQALETVTVTRGPTGEPNSGDRYDPHKNLQFRGQGFGYSRACGLRFGLSYQECVEDYLGQGLGFSSIRIELESAQNEPVAWSPGGCSSPPKLILILKQISAD